MGDLSLAQKADLEVRKTLGRGHLRGKRLEEAVDVYMGILRDYPLNPKAYLILGDLYLAGQDTATARQLYTNALQLDPGNEEIKQRLALARPRGVDAPCEPIPTHPAAISRLIQRLIGAAASISEKELEQAARLLDTIIHSPSPAEEVAAHLDQIDALIPALLELNIRQARMDGRPDLVEALQALQLNIELQISAARQFDSRTGQQAVNDPVLRKASPLFKGRLLLLVPDSRQLSHRATFLAEMFSQSDCEVTIASTSPLEQPKKPDVVIACNPHINPRLLEGMAACKGFKIPLIVDLDNSFETMPLRHPDYEREGLGTPANARAYSTALLLANLVTVPNGTLAASIHEAGHPVRVLPDGWARHNTLWEKPAPPHPTLNLGWVGYPGQLEDVTEIRRAIIRILREFPHTQIVIIGNTQVYQLFSSVPQNRRLYLPPVSYEDYPYLLAQIDLLLVPYQNIPFNYAQSDRPLMEAGIRRIPWIASPMPALASWKEGGALASTPDEWHSYLRHFILDETLRTDLGNAGYRRAQEREISLLGPVWSETIDDVIQNVASADR